MKGWKPHVVYELLNISRQNFDYIRTRIYPGNKKPLFSTYEILLYKIISISVDPFGLEKKRVAQIDWNNVLSELISLEFSGHANKIMSINMASHDFRIYDSIGDFKHFDRGNFNFNLHEISEKLLDQIINLGRDLH